MNTDTLLPGYEFIKDKEITLYTEGTIDGAHYLQAYDGKCKNHHGHTWFLSIWIKGTRENMDDVGIMFDFGNIKRIVEFFDHKLINELLPFNVINPTAENLVTYIYGDLKKTKPNLKFKVRIYETKVGKETYAEIGDFE